MPYEVRTRMFAPPCVAKGKTWLPPLSCAALLNEKDERIAELEKERDSLGEERDKYRQMAEYYCSKQKRTAKLAKARNRGV